MADVTRPSYAASNVPKLLSIPRLVFVLDWSLARARPFSFWALFRRRGWRMLAAFRERAETNALAWRDLEALRPFCICHSVSELESF
jgi:hypothetical protein